MLIMTKKIKKKVPEKLKLNVNDKDSVVGGCRNGTSMPLFSFAHITKSKEYNFYHFKDKYRNEYECRKKLDELLMVLSTTTWKDLMSRNKTQQGGFEILSYEKIKPKSPNLTLSNDSNIFVFRFGNSDEYRLMGWKKDGCQVLYVIGYDFDFSAYDHGK